MSGDYTKNTSRDKVEIYYIKSNLNIVNVPFLCARGKGWERGYQCLPL